MLMKQIYKNALVGILGCVPVITKTSKILELHAQIQNTNNINIALLILVQCTLNLWKYSDTNTNITQSLKNMMMQSGGQI